MTLKISVIGCGYLGAVDAAWGLATDRGPAGSTRVRSHSAE